MTVNAAPLDPATVIRAHAAFVQRVLRHLAVPERQIDDVSQEVFVVVCRQLATFEGRSTLRSWIYGICRNVASSARRRASEREALPGELPELDAAPTQDAELWVKQAHAQLMAALEKLDEAQRMVFVLYEIEELDMEEVAQAVGAPVNTCYSRLYAARDKVQAQVRRHDRFPLKKTAEVLS